MIKGHNPTCSSVLTLKIPRNEFAEGHRSTSKLQTPAIDSRFRLIGPRSAHFVACNARILNRHFTWEAKFFTPPIQNNHYNERKFLWLLITQHVPSDGKQTAARSVLLHRNLPTSRGRIRNFGSDLR